MNNRKTFGTQRENAIKDLKIAEGYLAFRAPASLGVADVIAIKEYGGWHSGSRVELIEVKANLGGPYMNFRPEERHRLSEAAARIGAQALLAYWPKRGEPRFIPESEWPRAGKPNQRDIERGEELAQEHRWT